jgi:hypothetical protein
MRYFAPVCRTHFRSTTRQTATRIGVPIKTLRRWLEGPAGLSPRSPDLVYASGRLSDARVKFKKLKSQEFVIGCYTLPEGSRKYFGSLLVGYQSASGLLFAGRVGHWLLKKGY